MKQPGWEKGIADYIASCAMKPFVWGKHDCCLFAADVVAVQTGVDHAARFRGRYNDEAGAERLLAEQGGLAALVGQMMGAPIPVAEAGRGDVVMWTHQGSAILGICVGAESVFLGAMGLHRRRTSSVSSVWRVA